MPENPPIFVDDNNKLDTLSGSGSNRRKESTASIDSRTVENLMASQKQSDLLELVEDVRGFLSRKEGLPGYVSRQHLCEAFAQIISEPTIAGDKKADVLNLTCLLINDLLQGIKKCRKSEIKAALATLLPVTIQQLPSADQSVQQGAIKILQKCLDKKNSPTVEFLVVDHVVASGINSRQDKVSVETMKLLPGLFLPDAIDETDFEPIIVALFTQLEKPSREQFAFSTLLRHREAMPSEEYAECLAKVPKKSQQMFNSLSQGYDNKDFHLSKRPPKDGVSFGMIPNSIINKLMDKHNRNGRAEGALLLRRELENSAEDKFGQLLPYVGSFIKYIGELLSDNNPKVTLYILECYDVLLAHIPQAMRQYLNVNVTNLMGISLDSKLQIKIEIFRLIRELMKVSSPFAVISIMAPYLHHKNGRMREDIANFVIFALLTFPSAEFDLVMMVQMMAPLFLDPKRRVRQACLESLAILAQIMGPNNAKTIYDAVSGQDIGHYDTTEDIVNAISCRISRKVLPRITDDGYVEYGLQVPYNIYTRTSNTARPSRKGGNNPSPPKQDADIDWILKGTGSLSRGSAGSVSLGIGGLGTSMSMVSLRSAKSSDGSEITIRRSQSVSAGDKSWNKHSRVPQIGSQGDSDSGLSRQNSQATDEEIGRSDDLEDDEDEQQLPEDVEPRMLTKEEKQKREAAYDTISRSQSELDLRKAATTPPPRDNPQSLVPVTEEEEVPSARSSQKPTSNKQNRGFTPRKISLADLGLTTFQYATQFDDIDDEGQDGDDAPGAFKRPKSAFALARTDLKSKDWESEIEGLEAIVRLVKWHRDVILPEVDSLLVDLCHETKNLRSQVTRAALQSFIKVFLNLGKELESAKHLDETITLLLIKTSDTNRFIRADANASLDAFSENVTIFKAISCLSKLGLGHKHVAARSAAGRVIANIVEKIGCDNIMEGYPDTPNRDMADMLVKTASTLIADGSLDTRTEAKRIFNVLIGHAKFNEALKNAVTSPSQLEKINKTLNSMKN